MPTLPSGLYLAIDRNHILEPDVNWFRAPKNHFWYWTPAPENPPPFAPEDKWEGVPTNAPVPTTREEMSKFIHVVIGLPNGNMYWQGDFLSDFPFYMQLDQDDLDAWNEWVSSEPVLKFIDETIVECQVQAEVNKDASGHVIIKGAVGSKDAKDDDLVEGYKIIDNPLKDSH